MYTIKFFRYRRLFILDEIVELSFLTTVSAYMTVSEHTTDGISLIFESQPCY